MSKSQYKFLQEARTFILVTASLAFIVSKFTGTDIENHLGVIIICLLVITIPLRFLNEYDGQIVITTTDEDKTLFSLELNGDPSDIQNMKGVSFKVSNISKFEYEEM